MGLGTGKQRQHFLCHCRSFLVKHQPLQQVPVPEVTAEMPWRGFCVLLPWKNHGAWESPTRQTRTSWHTPVGHHLHGRVCLLLVLMDNLLQGWQIPCPCRHPQPAYLTAPCWQMLGNSTSGSALGAGHKSSSPT